MQIDSLRLHAAQLTQRGIGMPLAGALYWLSIAALNYFNPQQSAETKCFYMFIGTGLIFPLGWALTKAFGGNLMAKVEPLTSLGMQINFIQFLYWPVIVAVFFQYPPIVPFLMAALFGSHFLPYGWFYQSRAYFWLGISSVIISAVLWFTAAAQAFVWIPLAMAVLYFACVILLRGENKRLVTI
jgi:hypothetical protein